MTAARLIRAAALAWAVAVALIGAACSPPARAQAYPNHPVKVVVPYAAGGYYDLVGRVLAQRLADRLGQPFVVENRAGANAIVGTEYTAHAPADGYTLMVGGIGPHAINPSLYPKLSYDPVRDFAPVILVAVQPGILVVHPALAVRSVRDLVELARARPGELSFASNGSGSTPHLAGELFAATMNLRLNHVPFKGSAPAITATLGGQTDMHFGTASDVLPHVQGGRLRALAVTGSRRLPSLPDLPTMIEAGVPGYETVAWFAIFAPAGVPRDILDRLNGELGRALETADIRDRLSAHGTVELPGGPPEALARLLRDEIAKWAKVVRQSGARAD